MNLWFKDLKINKVRLNISFQLSTFILTNCFSCTILTHENTDANWNIILYKRHLKMNAHLPTHSHTSCKILSLYLSLLRERERESWTKEGVEWGEGWREIRYLYVPSITSKRVSLAIHKSKISVAFIYFMIFINLYAPS